LELDMYEVWSVLGGNSATRNWRGSYKTFRGARLKAAKITGYGVYGIVVNRDGKTVWSGA
jgi:hypothetical protein